MSMIEIFNDGWCPACYGYVRPAWVDGGYGTVEWWGTRIRNENRIPVCVWCGEELMEEKPKEVCDAMGDVD